MNVAIYVALFGCIPIIAGLFSFLPPRRAVLVSILAGYLLLPVPGIPLPGFPNVTKASAVAVGLLIGTGAFQSRVLMSYRFRWPDAVMGLWCICPVFSAASAGPSVAAGLSSALTQMLDFGVPYLMGRLYFRSREDLVELVHALVVAGLLYMPLCWFEIRMSPTLHFRVYGMSQHQFIQTRRLGGWRPQVFLAHGIAVGLFMASASLAAAGAWWMGMRRRILGVHIGLWTAALAATTFFCKSTGAIALMAIGAAAIWLCRKGRRSWPAILLLTAGPVFVVARLLGIVETQSTLQLAESFFSADRVASLRTRLVNEAVIAARAFQRPFLGWGPWGDFRVGDAGQNLVAATDGFWVIVFGKYGLLGVFSWLAAFLAAPTVALRRWRRARKRGVADPMPLLLFVLLGVYLIDMTLNAMPNPFFPFILGAIATAYSIRNPPLRVRPTVGRPRAAVNGDRST